MVTMILSSIQSQMNFYGYPILLVFGNIGNMFTLILFYPQRQQPCSFYLFNSTAANILHLTIYCFFKIFPYTYSNGNLQDIITCKITTYIPAFLGQIPKTLLVCACIDRYMITSKNAHLRAFSTIKRAKYTTCAVYLFWPIIQIHLLIWVTVSNGQCTKIGWYITFSALLSMFFVALIPTIFLCVFSYLMYRNMKQLRRRIQPINHGTIQSNGRYLQKRDRDLLILVLAEVIIYIITTTPYSIISIEMMITQFMFSIKSLPLIQIEVFILNVSLLLLFIFSAIPFYTYMVASASFRREFKHLILNICRQIQRLPVDHTYSRTVQLGTQPVNHT